MHFYFYDDSCQEYDLTIDILSIFFLLLLSIFHLLVSGIDVEPGGFPVFLVATKYDLQDEKVVSTEEGIDKAAKLVKHSFSYFSFVVLWQQITYFILTN